MKLFGFYISRTDWENVYNEQKRVNAVLSQINNYLIRTTKKQSETYTGKDGRLRYKHNGQFAPDNRSKFKKTHDQLRAELEKPYDCEKIKGVK